MRSRLVNTNTYYTDYRAHGEDMGLSWIMYTITMDYENWIILFFSIIQFFVLLNEIFH